jgi:hypothetical protein
LFGWDLLHSLEFRFLKGMFINKITSSSIAKSP